MTSFLSASSQIAALLQEDDVLVIVDDDEDAAALAETLIALCPGGTVCHIPSSDALPGDVAPASPANVGARVAALRRLQAVRRSPNRARLACILSGEAAARYYPPAEAFGSAPPRLRIGDPIDADQFSQQCADIGYATDERVDEPGEMAVRGEVIDLFPADLSLPARIDIADGRIAAIRVFDPVTQLSVSEIETLEVGRASEPPLGDGVLILAHLDPAVVLLTPKADRRRRRFLQLAKDASRGRAKVDAVDEVEWTSALAAWRTGALAEHEAVPRFAEARSPLAALAKFVRPLVADGHRLVLAGSPRDLRFLRARVARRLGTELKSLNGWTDIRSLEAGEAGMIEMPADRGFVDDDSVWIAAADLLGSRATMGNEPAISNTPFVTGVADIRVGDLVVHEDHGFAVVAGLEPHPGGDDDAEMIVLQYADEARRLVGHDEADRIWRYGADAAAVSLDKLDGASWRKRRLEIDAAIAESAKGLTALAAARAKLAAPVIDPDPAAYERFAGEFPFNETADQARAISAVRDDLARGTPMDRLIVGDVGYGKTEVALRAAALAALAGYQVIVAAPTTVLVRQHLATFRKRFESSGIEVAGLSRLSSAAEKKAVKAGLADGSVRIVIGTGAVMAKGVTYAKLGLVIIDEEQRFGAADKARLRGAGDVHLLTLSATPIPRTLQTALVGLQEMSIIATPPARRQPIRTSLDMFDDNRVRTALRREKMRGGQSFVVVPRVSDMAVLSERLRRIASDLVLVEAHGKMPAAEIDAVMVGFAEGQGDILLATNIIEAGLDVPRANTMIVWRADRFGLAQLHQLRGRVGRGNRRGQILLLTEAGQEIGERTMKRLRTLASLDRLGAGFDIAAQDLDLRGAGDLLGETQAGHMKLIGVDLYQHLLGMALREARGEGVDHWTPELNIGATGGLPESWIPDVDVRLTLYLRLARLGDETGLDAFENELVDRFGPLPPPVERLMSHARLRVAARQARVERVDAGPAAIALTPHDDFAGNIAALGLSRKGGRLLLTETTGDGDRAERVLILLQDAAAS